MPYTVRLTSGLGWVGFLLRTRTAFRDGQVFTLIAMEPPIRVSGSGSADYVRDAKV